MLLQTDGQYEPAVHSFYLDVGCSLKISLIEYRIQLNQFLFSLNDKTKKNEKTMDSLFAYLWKLKDGHIIDFQQYTST